MPTLKEFLIALPVGIAWTFLMDRIAKRYHIRERVGDYLDRRIEAWWDRQIMRG